MAIKCIKDTIKNINIVIGCSIGCAYCYARINNNRFHTIDDFNNPEFFDNKLKMLDNKKHKAYLLTAQSDLSGWNNDWLEKVFEKINNNIDTQYLFLTKRPENIKLNKTPDNGWFGVTVTSSKEKHRIDDLRNLDLTDISWVVIGTETGNRKGKVDSKKEWVFNIYNQCKEQGIPVFMKEDLLGIINENEMIQEFPKEFLNNE